MTQCRACISANYGLKMQDRVIIPNKSSLELFMYDGGGNRPDAIISLLSPPSPGP